MDRLIVQLLEKTEGLGKHYDELCELIFSPEIIADNRLYRRLLKEKRELENTISARKGLLSAIQDKEHYESESESADEEYAKLLCVELKETEEKIKAFVEELKGLLLPRDENDFRDVVLELYANGGEAGAVFCGRLLSMYAAFAEKNGFKFLVNDAERTENGVKSASVIISGEGAYSRFKYESGGHRAIGIKVGSAVTGVVVLPEMEDVDVKISDKDIRIDIFHSAGAGGQNINKVETAVRITHYPTGIVVVCQDERSQLRNKERAMKVLRSKLYGLFSEKQAAEQQEQKRKQLTKNCVRTYSFSKNTVTDVRTDGEEDLEKVLGGELNGIVDEIAIKERKIRLAKL